MPRKLSHVAVRTTLGYAVVGALWILLSDRVLMAMIPDVETVARLETYKGWAFIAATAVLLYGTLTRQLQRWEGAVAAREKAEAERSNAASLLRAIAEQTPDSVFVKDLQCRYLLFNEAAAKVVGRPASEVLGKDDAGLFDHEGVRVVMENDREVMSTGRPHTAEQTLTSAGVTRTFLTTKAPYRDSAGNVVGLIGIARDISDRKRTEEALLESNRRLGLALDAARMGVWEWDLQKQEVLWSPECSAILGQTASGGTIDDFTKLVHPEDREKPFAASKEALANRTAYAVEFRVIRPDGQVRWVSNFGRGVHATDGDPVKVIGTVQDITERRDLEAQYRQSQKMEAIGQLAGGVAHDFNNLLTVIQGHSSLLLAARPSDAHLKESASEIAEAAERASSLTRQLLIFSRKQVMEPVDLDLNEVVSNMARMLTRIVGEHIALESERAEHLPLIHGDRGMIEQVVLNLAVNSRDSMPRGGRLIISTAAEVADEQHAMENRDATSGPCVRLSVRDTGCGIAPDALPHIFEPFFTTKEVGRGTGLGLATTYGIVKLHRGWISVASAVNAGTTFHVYFPAVTSAPPVRSSPARPAGVPRGTETILVVEDEPPVRNLVAGLLTQWGYRVLEAGSGAAAVKVWGEHRDGIDLLLTDMVMPDGITGRELAEQLHTEKPSLKVIYTSGYSPELAGKGLSQVEGLNFLQKPYAAPRLATAVRETLDRR